MAEPENRIKKTSKEAVIERTAYIWLKRFCAILFMDANHYTKLDRPVSGGKPPWSALDAESP
ncbi:MAG: hypothetical protein ACE5FU_14005 [Nitrospinota bacterium]